MCLYHPSKAGTWPGLGAFLMKKPRVYPLQYDSLWRKHLSQKSFSTVEWQWETQKKIWEKGFGKGQVVQLNGRAQRNEGNSRDLSVGLAFQDSFSKIAVLIFERNIGWLKIEVGDCKRKSGSLSGSLSERINLPWWRAAASAPRCCTPNPLHSTRKAACKISLKETCWGKTIRSSAS